MNICASVTAYDLNGYRVRVFSSIKAAGEWLSLSASQRSQISKAAHGYRGQRSAYGYLWDFKNVYKIEGVQKRNVIATALDNKTILELLLEDGVFDLAM